ncbi:MAG: hypothetical protein M0Z60_01885 [Nitrospiraceae bacterium]|nr:hypothetical protein [Nitrospiraceae bacterium]
MNRVLTEPLFYIDFFYGMSFLLMSFVVFEGTRRASCLTFITTFYMLVGFGLFHGITELTDWVSFILKTNGAGEFEALIILSQSCLITSFVLLLQFGINLLTYASEKKNIYRLLPALLFVVYSASIFVAETSHIRAAGLIARRGFGFSGAFLSGLAFFRLARSMKAIEHPRLTNGIIVAGMGFVCYAIFGGLVVEPILGLPIQLFRTVCALTIAASSFAILEILRVSKF